MNDEPIITFSKEYLIERFKEIVSANWVPNARHGNHGGIGNTLEDLLGIKENNLPVPNAAEWELKAQRLNSAALTTLFHLEPSPRAVQFVAKVLLPRYGWAHKEGGKRYAAGEMSFRQTISGRSRSDRGFMVVVDREARKILVSFDRQSVASHHMEWLASVEQRIELGELDPQPYWGFDDIEHKAGVKLLNCFYVQADVKREDDRELYKYVKVMMLQKFKFDGFLQAIEEGKLFVDFDARTGHNHGTKFRLQQNCLPLLYENVTTII